MSMDRDGAASNLEWLEQIRKGAAQPPPGGTIRLVTNQPETDDVQGYVHATGSGTTHGGANDSVDAAINLPVIKDTLAVRLSGYDDHLSGFYDRVATPGAPVDYGEQKGIDASSHDGGSISASLTLLDNTLTITPRVIVQHMTEDGHTYADYTAGNLTQYRLFNLDEPGSDQWNLHSLTVKYKTPIGTITSDSSEFIRKSADSDGKITPKQLAEAVEYAAKVGVHHVAPGAVSITQSTECGTVYDISQISAIGAVARHHRLPLRMDGARFANALVHLGCSPAEATWKSGVDVLSLGATKNGALCAEAVIFFDMTLARDFERRRKRGGHLWSKARFLSAQLLAYLELDLWLLNARQANAMAARLASGLESVPGVRLVHPVQANEFFAVLLPEAWVKRLEGQSFEFYRRPLYTDANGTAIRLVTSYMTRVQDVDHFVAALRDATLQKSDIQNCGIVTT